MPEDARRPPPAGIHSPTPVTVIRDNNPVAVVLKPATQNQ